MIGVVGDDKQIALAAGDEVGVGAQGAVDGDGEDVGVDNLAPLQFAQRVFVLVVGFQVVLFREMIGVDGIFLKRINADIGAGGGDHQGDEQGVAAGEFRDEEDGGQGCLHDARHDAGHARQHEIGGGHVPREELLGHEGDKESDEGADEQGGSEHTAHTAGGGRQRGSEDLQHEDAEDSQQQSMRPLEKLRERRVGKQMGEVPIYDGVDAVVSLAEEGGEEADETAEHQAADDGPRVDVGDALHLTVYPARGAQEEDRHQAGEQTQNDVQRDVAHQESLRGVEGEHHRLAPEEQRHDRSRDSGDEQRQDRAARQVEHQHLEGEDDGGDGGLARQQEGGVLAVHPEESSDVGTDGRTRQHDGRLQSHRTAETHRDGTGHHGGIDIVETQLAVTLADGLQDDADAVAQVVLHNLLDKEEREQDADRRENQVQVLDGRVGEDLADGDGGEMQQVLDDHRCSCAQNAYQTTQYQDDTS